VELWTIPAAELLEAGDVGLIPWVPLTDCADPPEKVMALPGYHRTARSARRKANLLAVTQVLAYLRYNDVGLVDDFGR
jgi:hypothetical protein